MNRILVTGATGFLGRAVLPQLTRAGLEVHAVTSRQPPAHEVTWHRADLLDPAQRAAVIEAANADGLLHLAWFATPPDYWRTPENLRWLGASLDLFRAFIENGGTRIVGAGSCAEYDWKDGYCTERATPLTPASLYGATKAACGSVLESYARDVGVSAAWARLFFLFGPHDSPVRLVPSLVRSLSSGEPAHCKAGNHRRDFLPVGQAAAAMVALLLSPVVGPVNVASGIPLRVGDVAVRLAEHLGRRALLTVSDGPAEDALVCADVTRLRAEVGWSPPTDPLASLDETVRWWSSPQRAQVAR